MNFNNLGQIGNEKAFLIRNRKQINIIEFNIYP